jgi:hypothetical protein
MYIISQALQVPTKVDLALKKDYLFIYLYYLIFFMWDLDHEYFLDVHS